MQLKPLKIYCDVVRRRSFSLAADDNGISQSSASQVVHQLEEQLGLQLLDRSKRPFVLTSEGERFYEGCKQLVRQYTKLVSEVQSMHDDCAGSLNVASIYSVGLAHMSAFMRQFASTYPDAHVHLEYLHPVGVVDAVENGDADFGILSFPEESRHLQVIPWRTESMMLVCHPSHRLANQQEAALSELSNEPFVAFDKQLRIRAEIDRVLMVNKVSPQITLEFDNVETIKRAIEINEGISLLPDSTVAWEVQSGLLSAVRLQEVEFERPVGIIHRSDRAMSTIGQQFIDLLQSDAQVQTPTLEGPTMSLRDTHTRIV